MRVVLENKVVLITGAASGIGRAAAKAFAARGARLALVDLQAGPLRQLREDLVAQGRARPLVVPADVSSDADLERLVKTVIESYGRVDVLINNAGLGLGGRFHEQDPARMRRLIDVNLYGLMRLTQLVIPVMREQGEGHIVNVSSQSAVLESPGYAVYAATKAGVATLTRILRLELEGSGIHLTLFFPGPTRTGMTEAMLKRRKGIARLPHHAPELPAARMVEAVEMRRRQVVASRTPLIMAMMRGVQRLFPRLMERYWRTQLSDAYFEGASLSGEKPGR